MLLPSPISRFVWRTYASRPSGRVSFTYPSHCILYSPLLLLGPIFLRGWASLGIYMYSSKRIHLVSTATFIPCLSLFHSNIFCLIRFRIQDFKRTHATFLYSMCRRHFHYLMGQWMLRSIYRKKAFTRLYIRLDSFCPGHHKLATIKSLASRVTLICAPSLLQDELDNLRLIFTDNGFPMNVIYKCIDKHWKKWEVQQGKKTKPESCSGYHTAYIGQKSSVLGYRKKKQVAAA